MSGKDLPPAQRRRLLAKVHIAKAWALQSLPGFTEGSYRDWVLAVSRGRSQTSAALDSIELTLLIKRFEAHGWKPALLQSQPPAAATAKALERRGTERQVVYLRTLWSALYQKGEIFNPSDLALKNFVRRVTGKHLPFCTTADLNKAIEALKDWLERGAGA